MKLYSRLYSQAVISHGVNLKNAVLGIGTLQADGEHMLCNLLGAEFDGAMEYGIGFVPEQATPEQTEQLRQYLYSLDNELPDGKRKSMKDGSTDWTDEERYWINAAQIAIPVWSHTRSGAEIPLFAVLEDAAAETDVTFVDIVSLKRTDRIDDKGVLTGSKFRPSRITLAQAPVTTTVDRNPNAVAAAPARVAVSSNMLTFGVPTPATAAPSVPQAPSVPKAPTALPAGWAIHPDDSAYAYNGNDVKLVSELMATVAAPALPKVPAAPAPASRKRAS